MTSEVVSFPSGWKRPPRSSVLLLALLLSVAQAPALESGLDLASFDRAARPQDDLYRFVNGGWIDRTVIPDERVTFSAATEVAETVEADLRAIVEAVAAMPDRRPGSALQQIGDMYTSLVDERAIEARGAAPLTPVLQRIDAIVTMATWHARRAGSPRPPPPVRSSRRSVPTRRGPGSGWSISRRADPAARSQLLPRRLRAVDRHPKSLPRVPGADFRAHRPARRCRRSGRRARARNRTRTRLVPVADSRSPSKTTNLWPLHRLRAEMPGFDWMAWARPQGIDRVETIVVVQPSFFREFAAMVPRTPLATWKAWLTARYVTAMAPYVSRAFNDARFEFFGRVLTGQEAPRPRWRRGVSMVNATLGDAVGRLYVEKHFPPPSRVRVERMVDHIVRAFSEAIRESDWMSSQAKAEAQAKLTTMTRKIGYPDTWRDYRGLVVAPDDLIGNLVRSQQFENAYRMARVERPADRGEWLAPPQTVNAYYAPGTNEIVFPAAMLQPPYFSARADDAVNYGAIGAVIGHEIAHALDDRGRHFDGDGALRDWWRPQDETAYRRRVAPLLAQFDSYSPLPGLRVNGALTLGENVGDLAGLAMAHRAYRLSLNGQAPPVLDGFTGDQRFFLGWARIWRAKDRDAYVRQISLTSAHAPAQYRANGPVRHLSAFHEAFAVTPNDRLYRVPGERLRIW